MRLLILAFVLSACTMPQKAASVAPAPPPRNFVCETFAALNPSAVCTPERTEPRVHSARVVLDAQLIRCAITDTMTSIVCSEPIVVHMQPVPAPPADAKPTKRSRKR